MIPRFLLFRSKLAFNLFFILAFTIWIFNRSFDNFEKFTKTGSKVILFYFIKICLIYFNINSFFFQVNKIDINILVNYLNTIEAFLIHIDFLKNEINNNNNYFEYILNKTSNNVVFGVFDNYSYKLKLNFIASYGIKCEVSRVKGNLGDKTVLTNVYIKCKNVNIQLAIFHSRGEYFWIGSDKENNNKLFFGDVDRAMNFFKIKSLDINVRIPEEIPAFLYDYKHSMFIECNKKLSELNIQAAGYRPINKKTQNDFLVGLKYIKNVLEGYNKNYWLAAGTLLGK